MRTGKKQKKNDAASLLSMTGFGKSRVERGDFWLEVEIKSVNHRFFDCALKLPRVYAEFEGELRAKLAEALDRGRVEACVTRGGAAASAEGAVVFNEKAYQALQRLYERLLPRRSLQDDEVRARVLLDILARREVLCVEEEPLNADGEGKLLFGAFDRAIEGLRGMRMAEGEKLAHDIRRRIGGIGAIRARISRMLQGMPGILRERLLARIKKLAADAQLDENRLAAEALYLADRADVTEELVRLESHLSQFEQILALPPNGRKLEFVLQEIGREINTIGSKAQDAPVQSLIIEAKAEIEKIREQLQNVV